MKNKERYFDYINFAYGIGAAIVIIGAMFKFLGWNYANEFFLVGLTTEALVFTISAFEYKKRKNVEVQKKYRWENVFPQLLENTNQETTPAELFAKIAEDTALQTVAMVKSLEIFNHSIEKLNTVTELLSENVNRVSNHILSMEKSTDNISIELNSLKENVKLNSIHFDKLNGTINQYENDFGSLNNTIAKINSFYADYLNKNDKNSEDISKEFLSMKDNITKVNAFYADLLNTMGRGKLPN